MKFTGIGPFLCGALLVTSISVFAAGKTPAAQGGTWTIKSVDEGSIRVGTPGFDRDTPAATNDACRAEVASQIADLEAKGYEPYAGAVYKDESYANEKVYFFRKKG